MAEHRGVTQRLAKPTINWFFLYIPWKDEHDHEVYEPDSPEGCSAVVYRSNTWPALDHSDSVTLYANIASFHVFGPKRDRVFHKQDTAATPIF